MSFTIPLVIILLHILIVCSFCVFVRYSIFSADDIQPEEGANDCRMFLFYFNSEPGISGIFVISASMSVFFFFLSRSLTVVIEQMEQFSSRLGELSSRVESTHEHTAHGLEQGARHRDEQLRSTSDTHACTHFVQIGQGASCLTACCSWYHIACGFNSFCNISVMQDRLAQQQKATVEERAYLKEIISRMDTQLSEQQRQLEKVRVTSD